MVPTATAEMHFFSLSPRFFFVSTAPDPPKEIGFEPAQSHVFEI